MRLPHGNTLRKIWLIAVLAYAVARAIAVDILLGDYGVSGQIYFAIEIATSIPFAKFSARLVEHAVNERKWGKSALVTAATYIAPDIYLLATIHSAPSRVYLWTIAVVVLLGAISVLELRRRIKSAK